ncbi:hypothetical protein Taro_042883 [Colocasia esculenta]|uniref:TF-B3 domain-containing protein n=1 Tax=Colocasia esculenta TaxID=4460 RepID=A0A843WZH0_COLES|nr:hypothetical protein [Colocasia esculenta]
MHMEFVQGRRERYYCEDEEPAEDNTPHQGHLPLAHGRFPPTCSSSSSSSVQCSNRWMTSQQGAYSSMENQHHPPGSGSGSGSSEEQQRTQAAFVEKEHMFDKVVTPSDVGKLNRLVIPKQHAEKYFPLHASANEKGLLLSFEDRTGKPWRFRYSYWNSSQSYVMTKGWSRFVKEKRLDAGDTVSFGRGVGEAGRDRLFIDWKHRPEAHEPPRLLRLPLPCHTYNHHHGFPHDPSSMVSFARSVVPWGHIVTPPPPASTMSAMTVYDHHRHPGYGYNIPPSAAAASSPYSLYLRSTAPATGLAVQLGVNSRYGGVGDGGEVVGEPMVLESAPALPSSAVAKRVRLFGVNLDCSPPESDAEGDAAAYENPRPRSLPSPQLSLGSSDTLESPRKGKQPMSLDLEM